MARKRVGLDSRITVGLVVFAAGAAGAGSALGAVVASPRTTKDIASLSARENAVVKLLKQYPGPGRALAGWREALKIAEAGQTSAEAQLSRDFAASPVLPPQPAGEQVYKKSAKHVAFAVLNKDPGAYKGVVITYQLTVYQYDSNTGKSAFLATVNAANAAYSLDDLVFIDVNPASASHVCDNTVVQIWGPVVGAYSYTTTLGGSNTVPEIRTKYIQVLSAAC